MKAYIIGFTKAHNYPAEAVEVLLDSFNKVSDKEDFLNLVSTFYAENPESKEYFEPSIITDVNPPSIQALHISKSAP